jgi:TrmH family RNA methyltransferase
LTAALGGLVDVRWSFPPGKAGSVTRPFITSTRNPQLKAVRRLRRSRGRVAEGTFLAEGRRQLECALAAGARVLDVYAAPELFLRGDDHALVARAARTGARIVELGAEAYRSISSQVRADGIAAVVERPRTGLDALPARSLLLVATGIERPGNLGAIVRTAEAAGAGGLVVCDAPTDVFHPEVVRGSVGTIFGLPLAAASRADALAWLRARGVRVVVATPDGERPMWSGDYSAPGLAVVVGGERYGVDPEWIAAADETVHIPMSGRADSLNVAVAAGIVLFEAARQRATEREAVPD